jgi:hypothetical protein
MVAAAALVAAPLPQFIDTEERICKGVIAPAILLGLAAYAAAVEARPATPAFAGTTVAIGSAATNDSSRIASRTGAFAFHFPLVVFNAMAVFVATGTRGPFFVVAATQQAAGVLTLWTMVVPPITTTTAIRSGRAAY